MLMQLSTRRHGGAQSRLRRRALARGQRLAARGPGSSRSRGCAPASSCRRRIAAFAVAEIERARRQCRVRQVIISPRTARSARPSALLADLRRRAARRPADRAARPGLQRRPRLDRLGLADLLHAGALRVRRPACRTRWRAWCSRACSSASRSCKVVSDRGRLHLGAGAVLAHGQALGAHAQGNAAPASARRRNTCASMSGSPRSRSRSRRIRSISPTSSTGSAGTG